MGINITTVTAYYHGNDGERGVELSYRLPFDNKTIEVLRDFVERDDALGFGRWLREHDQIAYTILLAGTCLNCTLQTIRESGILNIQRERKPEIKKGPFWPSETYEKALVVRDLLRDEDRAKANNACNHADA